MAIIPNITFNIEITSLLVTSVINLILIMVVGLIKNKKKDTLYFLLFAVSVFGWVVSRLAYGVLDGFPLKIAAMSLYFSATFIPFFLYLFIEAFPNKTLRDERKKLIFLSIPALFLAVLSYIPNAIIVNVQTNAEGIKEIIFGKFYYVYFLYIFIYFLAAFIKIFIKERNASGRERNQLEIVLLSIIISCSVGVLTNLILPTFNYFTLFWVGPLFSVFMVLTIAYAISKYQLFDAKLVTTETLTFLLWILILFKVISSQGTSDLIFNTLLFLASLVIGLYLIKDVVREINSREKIEKIAGELEVANEHLKVLDQQKSEFISLASHQLRGPLTAIKGYASMVLEGDFGAITDTVKDATSKILQSTSDLVVLVGDYLDVSRIEQGRMQYNFENFDLGEEVKTIITELKPTVEKAKLSLEFNIDKDLNYEVDGDKGKIKQAIGNIIDNSIKYTPQGSIHVWLTRKENKILLTVSDTGVGIAKEVLPNLFEKFTRAPDASKTNIIGTGLGLYLAKKMIEAHHGRIWAESAGLGKGTSFFIEIDALR